MKILQIASGDLWAGAEVQLFNLCYQLHRCAGIALHVVVLNEGQLAHMLRSNGVAVTVFDESQLTFWSIQQKLYALCGHEWPDIIHSHRQKENLLAAICRIRCGIPSITTAHGAPEFGYRGFGVRRLIPMLNRLVTRYLQKKVVAVSEDLRQKLLDYYPANHLALVRNGVDVSQSLAVKAVALDSNYRHIGIVGRLVPVKRIDLFLRAAAVLLSGKNNQYQFWVIGDGPLRVQHEALSRSLGIDRAVTFTGHQTSALPYLQSMDVLLMCSDHEGTPMTALEAMQCELPIVAHDVGGLRELLGEGECGRLVQNHTAAAYAAAVEQVLSSDSLRQQYISNGRQRLADNYSAVGNMQAYLALYREQLR